MERLKVSAGQMSSDTEQLKAQIDAIPVQIDALSEAMNRLGECWEGSAWIAFQNQLADDINNMNDMYQFLTGLIQKLDTAKLSYLKTEKQAYRNVDQIRF